MPVMKANHAAPAMKDAIVLDLGDIGRQAARIKMAAEEKAGQIVTQAEQRAREIIAAAESQGFEQGQAAGFEQGAEQGRQQGHAEALQQSADRLEQLMGAWADVAGQWDGERREMLREAKQSVLEFALRMTEKLVHRAIEVDPSIIADQVANALSHVLRPLDVTVRIHGTDRPFLEEAMPQLLAEFSHLNHVHLVDDEQITPGGCVVSFGEGQIDATIERQIQRVIDMILPPDENAPEDDAEAAGLISDDAEAQAQAEQFGQMLPEQLDETLTQPPSDDEAGPHAGPLDPSQPQ